LLTQDKIPLELLGTVRAWIVSELLRFRHDLPLSGFVEFLQGPQRRSRELDTMAHRL